MYSVPLPKTRRDIQLFRPIYDGDQSVWKTLNPLPPAPQRSRLDTQLRRFHDNVNEIENEIERYREERRKNMVHERKYLPTTPEDTRIVYDAPLPKLPVIPPISILEQEPPLPPTSVALTNQEAYEQEKESHLNTERRELPWPQNRLFKGPMENLYFPFGSPGGGAPNRDSRGHILTKVPGNQTLQMNPEDIRRKLSKTAAYGEELKNEIVEQHLNKLKIKQEVRAPFGDLADVIEHGKVGRPKYDDSSQPKLDKEHVPGDIFDSNVHHCKSDDRVAAYAASLENEAKFYKRMRNLEKLREHQEEMYHVENANRAFGKPGAGAPNPPGSKLRGGIEKAFLEPPNSIISKNSPLLVVSPDVDNPYAMKSWHQNHYDYPEQEDMYHSKISEQVRAPWNRRQY